MSRLVNVSYILALIL